MSNLYKENEPSGCTISDCCNLILSISSDPDPFGSLSDEEFHIVMSEIAMSISIISENLQLVQDSTPIEELIDLVHSMKEVNRMATVEVNENRDI